MKTFILKSFLLLSFCIAGQFLTAQHAEFEHNSSNTDPIVQLTEVGINNFTRLHFRNSNSADRWALNARFSANFDNIFGGYFNGSARFLFNEEEHAFTLFSDASQSDLDLVFELDAAGQNATSFGNIAWTENTGSTFAQISAATCLLYTSDAADE